MEQYATNFGDVWADEDVHDLDIIPNQITQNFGFHHFLSQQPLVESLFLFFAKIKKNLQIILCVILEPKYLIIEVTTYSKYE
jgi:hypothetical protein